MLGEKRRTRCRSPDAKQVVRLIHPANPFLPLPPLRHPFVAAHTAAESSAATGDNLFSRSRAQFASATPPPPPLPPAPHRACNEGNENHRMRAQRRGLKSHFTRHLPCGIIPSTPISSGVRGCAAAAARVTQGTRDEIYLILLRFSRVIRYARSARVSAVLLLLVNNHVDEN